MEFVPLEPRTFVPIAPSTSRRNVLQLLTKPPAVPVAVPSTAVKVDIKVAAVRVLTAIIGAAAGTCLIHSVVTVPSSLMKVAVAPSPPERYSKPLYGAPTQRALVVPAEVARAVPLPVPSFR